MKGLSEKQLNFLKEHDVPLHFVFDARGLSKSQYRPIMKELDKYVAFNVSPCNRAGHTLRTRSGHCIQCNTAHLQFQKRNASPGIVYIAKSRQGRVLKIGFTKAIDIRAESLNRTCYAGLNDWKILFAIKSKKAGKIESETGKLLTDYSSSFDYDHDGHWQYSCETYNCSYSLAMESILEVCKANDFQFEVKLNS